MRHKPMEQLTHLNNEGKATMVDVGAKAVTLRMAKARSVVEVPQNVMNALVAGDLTTAKGSVFQVAILAGIMAAKRTGELIPLCHPIGLEHCDVNINVANEREIVIECTTSVTAKTGIEMEALMGASVAALTLYDMCKALSHDIIIKETCLISKTGGKHDFKRE